MVTVARTRGETRRPSDDSATGTSVTRLPRVRGPLDRRRRVVHLGRDVQVGQAAAGVHRFGREALEQRRIDERSAAPLDEHERVRAVLVDAGPP